MELNERGQIVTGGAPAAATHLALSATPNPTGTIAAAPATTTTDEVHMPIVQAEMSQADDVIIMAALDDMAFRRWLHRRLFKAEVVGFMLLILYWVVQINQCKDNDCTVEIIVITIVLAALISRVASGLAQQSGRPPPRWDGTVLSLLIVIAHGVEACTVAFGSHSRAAAIAGPRLEYIEAAHGVCMLVGMVHAIQPISDSLHYGIIAYFNLMLGVWCLPLLLAGSEETAWRTHPVLAADGGVHQNWLPLCVGCMVGFNVGTACVRACVRWLLRPLWTQNQKRGNRLATIVLEKRSELFEAPSVPHGPQQPMSADESTAPSVSSSEYSDHHSGHTMSSTWPTGGAEAQNGRPACWPRDVMSPCVTFGGAETSVAPNAVRANAQPG